MKRRVDTDAWTKTERGIANYHEIRAQAQAEANADGFDRGLERNDVFKTFQYFMLPQKRNRRGYELRCEVVSCEIGANCQDGHGAKS